MADTTNTQPNQNLESDDLVRGVVGFFHPISGSSMKVVYTNFFTGTIKVKEKGLYLGFPWRTRAVEISTILQKIDTVARETHTASINSSQGPSIMYDTDYYIRIVDPEKFVDSINSKNVKQIKTAIGDLLDTAIRDYIVGKTYDELMRERTANLLAAINTPTIVGGTTLSNQIEIEYGVKVEKFTIRLQPPKEVQAEANRRKQQEAALQTAKAERETEKMRSEGIAERKIIEATGDAEAEKKHAEAQSFRIAQMIASGMTADHIAQYIANEALTNGTNPHTVVIAAANAAQASGGQGFDVATMTALVNALMNQGRAQQPQTTQVAPAEPAQTQVEQPQKENVVVLTPEEWAAKDNNLHLTPEDSAQLATERGENIQPGARYHIGYLTAEEKQRYTVAAQKGRTR